QVTYFFTNGVASAAPGRRGSDAIGKEVRHLGRRPAGVAILDTGRQGAGGDGRPRDARSRGRERDGGPGVEPPGGGELPGRSRGNVAGASGGGAGTAVNSGVVSWRLHAPRRGDRKSTR